MNEELLTRLRAASKRDALIRYYAVDMLNALKSIVPALWLLAAAGNKDADEKHAQVLELISKAEGLS